METRENRETRSSGDTLPSPLATVEQAALGPALSDALIASLPTLTALERDARAAALRPVLRACRAALAQAFEDAAPGEEDLSGAWSRFIDELVRRLYSAARAASPSDVPPIALVAVGGWGRGELCPYSDLDLWLLTDEPEHPEVARITDDVLYPLWDLKLDVGHAVRAPADCLSLAREDLTAATALLDARFLDGDDDPWRLLQELRAVRGEERDTTALVARLVEEKDARHQRFGETVYLLEPDVKNGEGGYRDLMVTLWAAKARFRVEDFAGLQRVGQATARQAEALEAARRFYTRLRTAMHLAAGRRQDRLLFELQEAVAPALVGEVAPRNERLAAGAVKPAVAPAVEALMQRYYLHAKAVLREGERVLERCRTTTQKRPRMRQLDHAFVLWNGQLTTVGPEVFRDRPSEMVRIFRVALDTGAPIHGHTCELIAEACADPDGPAARFFTGADPAAREAHRHFLALLIDPRDRANPSLLEQMHDLGLLGALMPEFAPCTGRVQHDLYHVFTVDQHQLYAVARLKELLRGELDSELPTAAKAMREVTHLHGLFLGTLLHDVGKPLGKGHAEKGARLAADICRRFGMDDEERELCEFLVRQHLLLAHLSQRRDLSDTAMIARVAAQLGSAERLRDLYLLTVADMSMVAPGNLTEWKEQLLRELYLRALGHYRRGPDLAGAERTRLVERRKAQVLAKVTDGEDEPARAQDQAEQWIAGLPDRYFAQTTVSTIVRHLRLSLGREGAVALDVTARRGVVELTVVADDAPGLLAKIAGVLRASRIDVHGARITSRRREGGGAEAIDVFQVHDTEGEHGGRRGGRLSPPRLARLGEDLRRVLTDQIDVEALVAERRSKGGLPARHTPAVATQVAIDDEVSSEFTVVDIYTQDRPGVLYTITRTLSALGLDIHLSKVATEADRVADVFYVRDSWGSKLGPERAAEVKERLQAALAAL